jgi:histidyl-tRNA synthetase
MESLGGSPTPAVGWAAGIERLAMMVDAPKPDRVEVCLAPLGQFGEAECVRVLAELRRKGVKAEMAFKGNLKKRLASASATGALLLVMIGDDELERGEAAVKDLTNGQQVRVRLQELVARVDFVIGFTRTGIQGSLAEVLATDAIGFISEPEQA